MYKNRTEELEEILEKIHPEDMGECGAKRR